MIVTKIIDFLSSKKIELYFKNYRRTQWFNEEQMRDFQLQKMKALINHCYQNVPYYQKIMNDNNWNPADFKALEDIKRFPILTKEIIKENYQDFTPINLSNIDGVKVSQTGGTTGNILYKRNDSKTRSSVWGSFKRFSEDWMGISDRDKKMLLMGGHVIGHSFKGRLKERFIGILYNQKSFSPYDTSSTNIENIIKELNTHKYSHIRSYSQFLYQLALKLKERKMTFKIKTITTTAEPLMPEHRLLFKEVFNAEVFDQYGCGEIGGIAYECAHHKGMHVTDERVLIELNEKNELIITDLDNFAMPFIRYWNADEALLSTEYCTCGRKSKLIKQILGRTCDYIIGGNGEILHWAYFWHLFFDSSIAEKRNLRKFQVVQEEKALLKIKLVCEILSQEEKKILIDNIQSRLGEISVVFSFEEEIENTKSGKYRPVINKLL